MSLNAIQMGLIKGATYLSDNLAEAASRVKNGWIDASGLTNKLHISLNEFNTGASGLDNTPTANVIYLAIIPANARITRGVVQFGAMGTDADLDLGIFGLDGSGRYDDTLGDEEAGTTLTTGQYYKIVESGGDFSNVGAPSNVVGTIFKATGTTPTSGKKVRQVGYADDADFFLDGIDVATAGQDTFADLAQGDANSWYVTKKPVVLAATALTADWAADKDLKIQVEFTQFND